MLRYAVFLFFENSSIIQKGIVTGQTINQPFFIPKRDKEGEKDERKN